MQKILVPSDGSDCALRAVRYAASVAKRSPDVVLELLHVQDPMQEQAPPSAEVGVAHHDETAAGILQAECRILDAEGVQYSIERRSGAPASEIAQHVYESQSNAIIMGTRGLGPIASVAIGSVATRVVHLVEVPVTLIK